MQIFMVIAFVAAFAAWMVTMRSATKLVREAPAGSRLAALRDLGAWRFDGYAAASPETLYQLHRFQRGVIVFFASVIAAALLALGQAMLADA
jgi:hypothetical protein